MKIEAKEIVVNGVKYVPKTTQEKAEKLDGLDYVICRTYSAGVFAGYLKAQAGKGVELVKARRIWYWDGAASISQLAMEGVTKPENCKFAMVVDNIILTEAIEIIQCTEPARLNIAEVPEWKK